VNNLNYLKPHCTFNGMQHGSSYYEYLMIVLLQNRNAIIQYTLRFKPLMHSGCYMHYQLHKLSIMTTECIYVFHMILRINSEYVPKLQYSTESV
jgi:hypothetical protein